MNAFKLKIKKKSMYTHTLEQIYTYFDEEYIYGIAIFEDDFRNFIQCLYAEKIPFPHTNKEVILRWA